MEGILTFQVTRWASMEVKTTFQVGPRSRWEVIQSFKEKLGRHYNLPIQKKSVERMQKYIPPLFPVEGGSQVRLRMTTREGVNTFQFK
jgi:hypothetical protein